MNPLDDLGFFQQLVRAGSLTATARELGISLSAVSKRLQRLERRLGVALAIRTTRRLTLTPEGELYAARGASILDDLGELEGALLSRQDALAGRLRVNATFGFGRRHVAPLISAFARQHPRLEILLELSNFPPNLDERGFDVVIRIGEPPDARWIARRILANRRVLCASPGYLEQAPPLDAPEELQNHRCLVVRENDSDYALWRFETADGSGRARTIRVGGPLASNDAEAVTRFALDGHGILLRSWWDVHAHLASGELVQLLPQWRGVRTDFHALYPGGTHASMRARRFVDFLELEMRGRVPMLDG
ncbi:MAG: LysR family transcriptional regulator [Acidihalobacter sp.]|uniref:LysR family transcriptional regulator n=1 Tax=Acidihalobacter sp. TaxID=1872108 RepID=UPI00307FAEB5